MSMAYKWLRMFKYVHTLISPFWVKHADLHNLWSRYDVVFREFLMNDKWIYSNMEDLLDYEI